jgi:UDP-3-O-acyl-N-acetylglucosamine deacetylase
MGSYTLWSDNYSYGRKTSLLTVSGDAIGCPEHVFAALGLLNMRSVLIDSTSTVELPVHPDTGESFYDALEIAACQMTGHHAQADDDPLSPRQITEGHRFYEVALADEFSCEVEIEGPGGASARALITETDLMAFHSPLKSRLGRARTWIRLEDRESLLRSGLCRGIAKTGWCRVLSARELADEEILSECADHKLYDLLGDLFLLGRWPHVRIFARNPSHRLNVSLLRLLSAAA